MKSSRPGGSRIDKGAAFPLRRPYPPTAARKALKQGLAAIDIAPDGAVGLFRKTIQLTLASLPISGSNSLSRLAALESCGWIDREAAKSARRAWLAGDWGIHATPGVSINAAGESLYQCLLFLDSLGFDVAPAGHIDDIRRVRRYLAHVGTATWDGPMPFSNGYNGGFPYGATLDVLFRCDSCESEVLGEDILLPSPNFAAESGSDPLTSEGTLAECPFCGREFTLVSSKAFGGWDIELETYGDEPPPRRRGNESPAAAPSLPAEGQFLYRVTFLPDADPDEQSDSTDKPAEVKAWASLEAPATKGYELDW